MHKHPDIGVEVNNCPAVAADTAIVAVGRDMATYFVAVVVHSGPFCSPHEAYVVAAPGNYLVR